MRESEPMASLSIVVPVLDEADAIEGALAALRPLRARGAEAIVVDGGSSDDTAARAAPHADLTMSAPRGRAAQMNAGANAARGDVLVFLHCDTRLPDDADRLIENALRSSRAVWGRFDVRIAGRSPLLPLVAMTMNLRSRLSGIATGDQAIFVRRDVFEAVGRFPDMALMEDIAISRRLKRLSSPARIATPVVTSGRRWDERGAMRTILLMWRLRSAHFFGAQSDALARRYGYVPR